MQGQPAELLGDEATMIARAKDILTILGSPQMALDETKVRRHWRCFRKLLEASILRAHRTETHVRVLFRIVADLQGHAMTDAIYTWGLCPRAARRTCCGCCGSWPETRRCAQPCWTPAPSLYFRMSWAKGAALQREREPANAEPANAYLKARYPARSNEALPQKITLILRMPHVLLNARLPSLSSRMHLGDDRAILQESHIRFVMWLGLVPDDMRLGRDIGMLRKLTAPFANRSEAL